MSTGKRAFDGKSTANVVASIMNSEPEPLTALVPLTPAALEWTIKKCLAKDREERWQNAGDLAGELRWIQDGGSPARESPCLPLPTAGESCCVGRCWPQPWLLESL
jgi:hypothetical protein